MATAPRRARAFSPQSFVTLKDLADRYGTSYWSVWRAVQAGELKASRMAIRAGLRPQWCVRGSDALAWRRPVRAEWLYHLDTDALVTLAQVAAHYNVSYATVWRAVKDGKLAVERLGPRGVLCVRVQTMRAWGSR